MITAALRYLWCSPHFTHSADRLKQCSPVSFIVCSVSEHNAFKACARSWRCYVSRANREYYLDRNAFNENPRITLLNWTQQWTHLLQNASQCCWCFLFFPALWNNIRQGCFLVTSCLSLPAPHSQKENMLSVRERQKNLSATSATGILREHPKAFVDLEFICVKTNPPETSCMCELLCIWGKMHRRRWVLLLVLFFCPFASLLCLTLDVHDHLHRWHYVEGEWHL